jgi:hypothetical protein
VNNSGATLVVVVSTLIVLTMPGGHTVDVSPDKIVSLREPSIEGHVDNDVHCIVNTVDGKFLAVIETCTAVLGKFKQEEGY